MNLRHIRKLLDQCVSFRSGIEIEKSVDRTLVFHFLFASTLHLVSERVALVEVARAPLLADRPLQL